MTTFGEQIRTAREARGWSLADLEAACGVNRSTISNYENGRRTKRPSAMHVESLNRALGVQLDVGAKQSQNAMAGRIQEVLDSGFVKDAKDWATRAGLAECTVRQFLLRARRTGKASMSADTVAALAAAAGVRPQYLLTGDTEVPKEPENTPSVDYRERWLDAMRRIADLEDELARVKR